MAGITGLGSGIEIKRIVTALVNAERAPKTAQLSRLESATTAKFSALGQVKSSLSDFQASLKNLKDASLYEKRTATSSDSAVLSATASASATSGSYKVSVERLATASKVGTAALASGFTASAAGEMTVKVGADDSAGVKIAVAQGDDLATIRDKMNSALKDKGVTVNLLNDPGTGTSRLVMTSKTAGEGKDVYLETSSASLSNLRIGSINYDDPDNPVGALAALTGTAAGYLEQAGDAAFKIDGLSFTSSSNSVSDVIPGVTLSLSTASEPGKTTTLTVGQDVSGVKGTIKKFVDAYNKVMSTTKQLTAVTSAGDGNQPVTGALVGDSTVRTLVNGLRGELANPVQGTFRTLADLGITTQKDGTLAIDDTKLTAALTENYDAVGAFLAGNDGLMARLNKRVDAYAQTGGILQSRMDGLQGTLKSIDKQRDDLNRRVSQIETRLYAQYNAMDSLVGQLKGTSDWLSGALSNLPGVIKKS